MIQIPVLLDANMILQAAATQTESTDGAAFDRGEGFDPGSIGEVVAAVCEVTALDLTTGNETYTLKLQESADGTTGWTDCSLVTTVTAVGTALIRGFQALQYLRVVSTLGGTTPSITFKVWGRPMGVPD